jgi:hypothetical protein
MTAALRDCDRDQSSFLDRRQDLEFHAGFALDFFDELRCILSFAHGGSGHTNNSFSATRLGNRAESLDALGGAGDRFRRQASAHQRIVTEAYRILFASEHGKGIAGGGIDHNKLDRIRADVDGGNLHADFSRRSSAGC